MCVNFHQYSFEWYTIAACSIFQCKAYSGLWKQILVHFANIREGEKLLNRVLLFALLEALSLMVSLIGNSWNKDPPNPH